MKNRDATHRTHRDGLPAVADSQRTAEAVLALCGGTNTEDARRYMDCECRAAEARLAGQYTDDEMDRIRISDATFARYVRQLALDAMDVSTMANLGKGGAR